MMMMTMMTSNTTRALKSLHDFFSDDTNRLYSPKEGECGKGRGRGNCSKSGGSYASATTTAK